MTSAELFSGQYENDQLLQCGCYAEISVRNPLSGQEFIELESLKTNTMHSDLITRTAECRTGIFSEHTGIWRSFPVCGKSGRRETDGGGKPRISANRKRRNPSSCRCFYQTASDYAEWTSDSEKLLPILAERAHQLLHRRIRIHTGETTSQEAIVIRQKLSEI